MQSITISLTCPNKNFVNFFYYPVLVLYKKENEWFSQWMKSDSNGFLMKEIRMLTTVI